METLTVDDIKALPCFQQRTSKYKQYVRSYSEDGENFIIKGPFADKSAKKNIELRAEFLKAMGRENIIYPDKFIKLEDGYYMITRSLVRKTECFESKAHTESFSDNSYDVIERSSYSDQVRKLSDEGYPSKWDDTKLRELVFSSVLLYIIGVGDTGPANVLYLPKSKDYFIIDYDMKRGSFSDNPWFYFSKAPKRCQITEAMCEHYLSVRKEILARADEIRGLLKKIFKSDWKTYNERVLSTALLLKEHSSSGKIKAPKKTATKKISSKPQGEMEWNGPFSIKTVTYSGKPFRLCISALQKYIRRGNVEKSLMVANELYHMRYLDNPGYKGCWTNFQNRLVIIAIEDIGPANPDLLEVILGYVLNGNILDDNDENKLNILRLVERMARSPKTRIISHLRYKYRTPVNEEITNHDEFIKELTKKVKKIRKSSSNNTLDRELVYSCMRELDALVFLEHKFTQLQMNDSVIREDIFVDIKYSKLITLLKRAYLDYQKRKRTVKKGMVGENLCFLATAFLLSYLEPTEDGPKRIRSTKINLEKYNIFDYELEIDEEYINDKHVPGGDKDISLFLREGAHVENQHMGWFSQELYDAYTNRPQDEEPIVLRTSAVKKKRTTIKSAYDSDSEEEK